MRIEIGRIRHVVSGALHPPDEIDLPLVEVAQPRVRLRPIERDLHGRRVPGHGIGPIAVEAIQTLARLSVVGIVVVRLVGIDALLVQERRGAAVLDDEDHVVLQTLRIDEDCRIHAARPITRDGQRVAGRPVAGDQSRRGIRGARRLLKPAGRIDMEAKPAAQPAVPAEAVEIDRVVLRGIHADVERDGLALVDAGRRRVSFDLLTHIVADVRPHPAIRAWLLVLENDRIAGLCRDRHGKKRRKGEQD